MQKNKVLVLYWKVLVNITNLRNDFQSDIHLAHIIMEENSNPLQHLLTVSALTAPRILHCIEVTHRINFQGMLRNYYIILQYFVVYKFKIKVHAIQSSCEAIKNAICYYYYCFASF